MQVSWFQVHEVLPWLIVAALGSLLLLWLAWLGTLGFIRATLATCCRAAWLAPLFICFFPVTETQQLPRALALKPVHILLDDSSSMQGVGAGSSPLQRSEGLIKEIDERCARLGCLPKVVRLSEQDHDTKEGFTPLSHVLESWLYRTSGEPWLLLSDGGDYMPTSRWPSTLRGSGGPSSGGLASAPGHGLAKGEAPRGLIVGFGGDQRPNIWVKEADIAPFAFDHKPLSLSVSLKRSAAHQDYERVQVQVLDGTVSLMTVNAEFAAGAQQAQVSTMVPPLPRGQHLLTVRALPIPGETALWDNTVHVQTEVLPNTVGVLHLLGSPSWDGRFLRRYLKSEPKYDLISFFILRDPWDSQQVNERELSLIPFPVERLFRDELPNFRVVVLQNFTLFQFLLPEYQNNLVKFVQDGGGLLFIGGPRALTAADLSSSPLKAILPFELAGKDAAAAPSDSLPFDGDLNPLMNGGILPQGDNGVGPTYDPTRAFRVELAKPDPAKRALANVYEDWEALAGPLTAWKTAKGLHHMERVKMKEGSTTVLLNARSEGAAIPLAVASYPGKGRALWIFSDAFNRLALTASEDTSRQVYNKFMQGAMTWLMRQDLRRPLVATGFTLSGGRKQTARWRVTLQGPAARYYQPAAEWPLTVCGQQIAVGDIVATQQSDDEWELRGTLPTAFAGGERCTLEINGNHPAFGSVKASVTAVFPAVYKDSDIGAAPQKLEDLAHLTQAALTMWPDAAELGSAGMESLDRWLAGATGQDGMPLPSRFKTLRNFFWILDTPWFWLLLLGLPLEVVVRRWDQIQG